MYSEIYFTLFWVQNCEKPYILRLVDYVLEILRDDEVLKVDKILSSELFISPPVF